MTLFFQFLAFGLGSGALIGLMAIGLVVVYRGSGVVNFAHGAIAMAGTYVFWDLNENGHVPYFWAVLAGVAFSALLGALAQLAVMRKLVDAAPVTRLIATLGMLTILEQLASRRYPDSFEVVHSFLPTSTLRWGHVTIAVNGLYLLGICIVLVILLELLYQKTQFGRATMATRENRRAAAALGYSSGRLALINWMLGSALAGLAGILLAPVLGLSVDGYTLLILPVLAAAIVGNLTSFPITLLGGLLVGIVQSELLGFVSTPGWPETAPFIVVIVLLVFRGRDQSIRTRVGERLTRIGTGRVRPWVVLAFAAAAFVVITFWLSPSGLDAATISIVGAIIVLSFIPLTGYTGQLSLAQFAFAGFGAWVSGQFVATYHYPFLLSMVIAVVATSLLGLALGLICIRLQGVYLAIATLGLAVALEEMVFDNSALTGNVVGIVVGTPHIFGINISAINHENRYAIVCLICFIIVALGLANLRRGRSGRQLLAGRGNDRAASSLGINTVGGRLFAFSLSGGIAALGGTLLAFRDPSIVYTNFTSISSVEVVAQAIVGGVGWIAGAIIGGLGQLSGVVSTILGLFGQSVANDLPLILAILLLITITSAPDGAAALMAGQINWVVSKIRRGPVKVPAPPASVQGSTNVAPGEIEVKDVFVRFGGVHAIDDVSFLARSGEVVGIIGPNGAGKTTFIDVLTGFRKPTSGTIGFNGHDVTGHRPAELSRLGVTRSFQSLELFDDMTVLENLRVASEKRSFSAYFSDLVYPRTPPLTQATSAAIAEFGLEDCLNQIPSELAYGRRRLVAIARAVATEPSILCLDEPAAGLDDTQTRELSVLLRRLVSDWGMGIVLVEHNVEMVLGLCDRIYVLNFGKLVAEGTPAEIRNNRDVVSIYLGASDEDEHPTSDAGLITTGPEE